jgi:hypothetical protein
MSQLFYTLEWGESVGTSLGLFVLGVAVLVMVGGIVFDRNRGLKHLNWVVNGLSATAVLLIIGGLLHLV